MLASHSPRLRLFHFSLSEPTVKQVLCLVSLNVHTFLILKTLLRSGTLYRTMSHKLEEPYSGKNPVPQIATKLTALVNPEHATRAKAAQLQDQSERHDQKQTEKRARRLAKGYVMHVVDPVTGDELDIKNADEEPDLSNKGENVLDTGFPPLGTLTL